MKILSFVGNSSMCGANYVHYCLMDDNWDVIALKGEEDKFYKNKIVNLNLSYLKIILSFIFNIDFYKDLDKYDIILGDGILPYLIMKRYYKQKKLFAIVHNDFKINNRKRWKIIPKFIFNYIYRYALKDLDVITTSSSSYISMSDIGKTISVINNGVSIPVKNENENEMETDLISIWYIGRIIPIKRVVDIIKSLSLIKSDKYIFEIVGNGSELNNVIDACANYGINYKYHGYLEQPFYNVKVGDIFILPSEVEGRSIALMEAIISGCYSIVSNIDANLEFEKYGCVFFDVGNINALTDKLEKALELSIEERFNQEIVKIATADFSISTMKREYLKKFIL